MSGRLLITVMTALLFLMAVAVEVRSEQESAGTEAGLSSLSPPLVREGDFALRLLEAVGLGHAGDEAEAQSRLSEAGVSPRAGWMADYPVTPLVLGELREAVGASAASENLAMGEAEALDVFDRLASELGLEVEPDAEHGYSEESFAGVPVPGGGEYDEPPESLDDDAAEGPGVMTYYPPPSRYYSSYDWVPYPFYFSGSYFSGFFILRDFHKVHKFDRRFSRKHDRFGFHKHSKQKFFSNHRWNRRFGRTELLRPGGAARAEGLRAGRFGRESTRRGTRNLTLGPPARHMDREAWSSPGADTRDSSRFRREPRRLRRNMADRGISAGPRVRSFRDSGMRSGKEGFRGVSRPSGRGAADSFRSSGGSFRRSGAGSFKNSGGRGRAGNRSFSGPGGFGRGR